MGLMLGLRSKEFLAGPKKVKVPKKDDYLAKIS
jgi:hypothetical protein